MRYSGIKDKSFLSVIDHQRFTGKFSPFPLAYTSQICIVTITNKKKHIPYKKNTSFLVIKQELMGFQEIESNFDDAGNTLHDLPVFNTCLICC